MKTSRDVDGVILERTEMRCFVLPGGEDPFLQPSSFWVYYPSVPEAGSSKVRVTQALSCCVGSLELAVMEDPPCPPELPVFPLTPLLTGLNTERWFAFL